MRLKTSKRTTAGCCFVCLFVSSAWGGCLFAVVLLLLLFRPPKRLRKEEGESGVVLIWNIVSLGLVLALPQVSCATVRKLNTDFPEQKAKFSLET